MTPIKVMVVDDSVVVRRLVTNVLDEDADIEVLATAANGQLALDKLELIKPDVVTLDIEMPVLNGIETLREIRKRYPRLPVIMFSTLTERGAIATLDALAAGANDFVAKPANVGSVTAGMQAIRDELIPKVKVLCGRPATVARPTTARTAPEAPAAPLRPTAAPAVGTSPVAPRERPASFTANRMDTAAAAPIGHVPARRVGSATGKVSVVVIGVSTGGPNALAELWPHLRNITVPVLVVQHMPPVFTAMLAKRLDGLGTVPIAEGTDGTELRPGEGWLAPGDHHMVVEHSSLGARIRIVQDPPENSCRPAVDPLFRTAADVFGSGVLAVVLTGMGADGMAGAARIRAAGGTVIAQDEASSVVWGMPGAVVNAGLADAVVPLSGIAAEIIARVGVGPARTDARLKTAGLV